MTSADLQEVIDYQTEEFLQSPLGKAFNKLNAQGIRAYKECGRDPKDGLEIITEDGQYKGPFTFFHEQQHWTFLEENKCSLGFGCLEKGYDLLSLGDEIVKVLEEQGIKCSWDKGIDNSILLETSYRYKDFFSLRNLIITAFHYKYLTSNTATESMIREITCFLDQDDGVNSFNSYDLNDEEDLENLDTIFQTFMVPKEELISHRSYTMLCDPESYRDYFSEDNVSSQFSYKTLEELIDNVEWDAIWGSIHYFCDKSVIRNRIAKICGLKAEEIDLEKLNEMILDK
jgi:hypothetical protein